MDLPSFADIPEDEVVEFVMENLEITNDKEEPVIYELVYLSSKPDDAQTVLNNLIATYKDELDEQYRSENDKYVTLLKQVQSQFKGNYERLQKELAEAQKEDQAAIVAAGGMNVHQVALRELGEKLSGAQNLLTSLNAERVRVQQALAKGPEVYEDLVWALVNEGKIKATRDRLQDQEMRSDAQIALKLQELEIAKMELSQRLGASHPRVRAVKDQIEYWNNDLQGEGEDGEAALDGSPETILQRYLLSLNQQISDEQAIIDTALVQYQVHDKEATRLAAVRREIDSINMQMDDVREFMKTAERKIVEIDPSMELNNRNRSDGFRFQTLMNATYGEVVWPILPVILGVGGLLGLLSGFGLGCLVELADKTFHNPDEIMKQFHVPLIGHIPVIGQSKRYLVENSLIEPIVCTYHRPKSQVSESFRAVRTALYFNTQGKQHSVIQVTSPTPGDGKSTLASNLAVSIAQSGKRVLLVDGDMRRPRQAATFGISAKYGFATVLSGQSQWRDVVYECEEIDGLTVMPCGSKPNNPAELSSSPQVKELIEEMREEFDFVIIDTPPLLAVTDACPIAARVDGVILCIRIKKNVRVSAERATEMLSNLGAKCIGLVVNGVGAQSGYGSQYTYGAYRAGYSYNGYGYGYGYGYGAGKYYDDEKAAAPNSGPKHIEAKQTEQHPPVA